jgi:type II restriction/modification system DNA methylase subunit YeeA
MSAFNFHGVSITILAAFCNTPIVIAIARAINPTVHFQIGNFMNIPFLEHVTQSFGASVSQRVEGLVLGSRSDWDAYERSWDFQSFPLLTASKNSMLTLESTYTSWITQNRDTIAEMQRFEEENNRLFIDAYGLADELTPDVPIEQITLTVNPAYRYGGKLTQEEQWTRFRRDTIEELVSYAVGCMMGRYSIDEPGLIYAHAGNVGFDAMRYKTFPADADGIIPVTDELWFEDDAANRVHEFVRAIWGSENLDQNMTWLANNLSAKASESPIETIRRYIADKFFKDHLQTYNKRPIYWLFSSGKQGAFQALVYLHRYHEGTLARMRAEYVVPLTGKMQSRIEMLEKDKDAASSTAARNKIAKQIESLKKKHIELLAYDEKLRHYADMRITLDLDDGVKVNYGKFGDLLAEVKAVTGGAVDE